MDEGPGCGLEDYRTAPSSSLTSHSFLIVIDVAFDLQSSSWKGKQEVRALMADEQRHPTAFQAIGYKEIAAAIRGEAPMEEAVRWTKRASRNLAKRQLTWFRRDDRVIWLEAEGESAQNLAARMRDIIEQRAGIHST